MQYAAQLLREGKLVAIPTETVYGLAANALHEAAVLDVFRVKERPAFDPLIVHVPGKEALLRYVSEFPSQAADLAGHFWPGPLTMLLPKKSIIPDVVTSGLNRVAVRVPGHPLTQALLQLLDFPLAAPSANPFGYISPTTAGHVEDQLGTKIPYILDGGPCRVGLESTIVGFEDGEIVVYRKGGIAIEALESVCGKIRVMPHSTSSPESPGMLKSHYAPRTKFYILEPGMPVPAGNVGVLSFSTPYENVPVCVVLSEQGNPDEAASRLFAAMRRLDTMGLDAIYAEKAPEAGLGRAINDRLRRAAAG